MSDNELTYKEPGLAMNVHEILGPGLLEHVYRECLFYKIVKSDFHAKKEKPLLLIFDKVKLDCDCRLDILVERRFVIEIKSVEFIKDVHVAQTLTYLRLGNYKPGLLINFNVVKLKEGVRRLINS